MISVYGAQLTQQGSYLVVLYSSHFESDGTVNYDFIVTDSTYTLLVGSLCVFPMAPIWPMLQNISNTVYCFPYTKSIFLTLTLMSPNLFLNNIHVIVISGHSIIIIITNYFTVERGCFTETQILQFMNKKMYLILALWRPEQKRFVVMYFEV